MRLLTLFAGVLALSGACKTRQSYLSSDEQVAATAQYQGYNYQLVSAESGVYARFVIPVDAGNGYLVKPGGQDTTSTTQSGSGTSTNYKVTITEKIPYSENSYSYNNSQGMKEVYLNPNSIDWKKFATLNTGSDPMFKFECKPADRERLNKVYLTLHNLELDLKKMDIEQGVLKASIDNVLLLKRLQDTKKLKECGLLPTVPQLTPPQPKGEPENNSVPVNDKMPSPV